MSLIRECWQHLYEVERKRIPPTPDGDLRLHRLERPTPWPNVVWPHKDHIEQYPCYPPLIKRLAQLNDVEEDQIVLGAGIEDFIRTLILLTCEPKEHFVFTWPTCAMFEVYSKVFDVKPIRIVTNPDVPTSIWDILTFSKAASLILLPNPGQPVETCFSPNDIAKLANACRENDCVLALDEAYYGFGAPTAVPLIKDFDNLVVLRTFSKAFGAAGIRVGYAIGQRKLIQPLDAIRLSGEIAGPSLRAATRLLALYPSTIEPGIQDVIHGRNWLKEQILQEGYEAKGQWANHVLVDLGNPIHAKFVTEALKEHGVHVKGDYPPPLDRHILVTAGPVPLMERFMDALREVLGREAA